jgi:hypothetical protein
MKTLIKTQSAEKQNSERNNTFDGFIGRLNTAKDRINDTEKYI